MKIDETNDSSVDLDLGTLFMILVGHVLSFGLSELNEFITDSDYLAYINW